MERSCLCCEKSFKPHHAVRHQRYCGEPECQKSRKRKWQKAKLGNDGDYRANQAEAQRQWRSRNKDYWKAYRRKHPVYTEANRTGQRERNRRRRFGSGIAKMDELSGKRIIRSGRYRLIPVCNPEIAKMDELIVELGIVSRGCDLGSKGS
jgi:hypothetical protein